MSWSLESPYHATVMIVRHAPNIQQVCSVFCCVELTLQSLSR